MTEVKLCGNRSQADYKKSVESGAPYIGVIFAESKRQVLPEAVNEWIKNHPPKPHQRIVGVFVNPSIQRIEEVLSLTRLDILQLHGNETEATILAIKERFPLPVWKAIPHHEKAVQQMKLYEGIIDGYVIDAKVQGAFGGTGISFDWSHVPTYINEGKRQGVPCFIAGGVRPENVDELLGYEPFGIDVSSGTETDEQKDTKKIESIVRRSIHVSHLS
ncbi:N-(5'-phosphoribosyl)anthranilate isomerase [Pontibacillus halophilus JSM 076056 = DSM 19796]|uniref:N-(5'-phosphoribosyl)anthranilate isomerase n=1 Tax=Pontibacillus halophilus JSM 076056 = DSM 19796 TaxID=1385510 RepID=A0A0A5GS89_9BACI|nr:phosphoribosylanthranilate isomerase [Pontibacillus halophilus]KGX93990.1 N-(5'-phosphoribosyl)anthranilate isomerase [Pontibacillus halophilus JSM 076056 = DSM 19796]